MKITSSAFAEGAMIPRRYTCDAENVSPPLQWADVPPDARSLALIADDPDAPAGTFIHWVLFDLPVSTTGLPEGVKAQAGIEGGGMQGTNSFRKLGYDGPCPPSGTHRYYFRLYALDTELSLKSDASAQNIRAAMKGHVLAEGALMGQYKR
jgi:Raf kinase inhibitor-like YbhB/YbcL family protein